MSRRGCIADASRREFGPSRDCTELASSLGMLRPAEITYRNLRASDALDAEIREHAAELDHYAPEILRCHVVLETHHRHHRKGRLYHVRVELDVPGGRLVVNRDPELAHQHEDVHVAIRDAFDAATRELEDHVRRRRGDTKTHEVPPHGRVVRLFPDEGYGFIAAGDGKEIYFHRNAVLEDAFDTLEVGSEVRYVAREGESINGPQASTVRLIGKHHLPEIGANR